MSLEIFFPVSSDRALPGMYHTLVMTLSNLIWRPLLASPGLRRRLAWQLKHYHPEDFDARVPIGEGLSIPLFDAELSASFSEIFLLGEYQPLLDSMPLPDRWLDLGCYAGYFSLWMEWQRRRAGSPLDAARTRVYLVNRWRAL